MAISIPRMLLPHRLDGLAKDRLSRLFDAGYVMLDRFVDVAAYTLGINDDVSWDRDIAAQGLTGVPVRPHYRTGGVRLPPDALGKALASAREPTRPNGWRPCPT